ncbi:MAG: cytochrome c [Hyphomonadaceae bacterium]
MFRAGFAMMALFVSACAAQAPTEAAPSQRALVRDGRDIAEAQCAGCHAIGEYDDSPVAAAPVFRTLLSRYNADVLEEELINGIRVSHPMPEFQFNPQGTDALIAYLRSVQQP